MCNSFLGISILQLGLEQQFFPPSKYNVTDMSGPFCLGVKLLTDTLLHTSTISKNFSLKSLHCPLHYMLLTRLITPTTTIHGPFGNCAAAVWPFRGVQALLARSC